MTVDAARLEARATCLPEQAVPRGAAVERAGMSPPLQSGFGGEGAETTPPCADLWSRLTNLAARSAELGTGALRRHECHRGTHECVRYKRPLVTNRRQRGNHYYARGEEDYSQFGN
jgi:hypothetical protein